MEGGHRLLDRRVALCACGDHGVYADFGVEINFM